MTEEQVKQILRRLESVEKILNLQYQDRNIFEDILLKIDGSNREIGNLREEVKLVKERVEKLEKNMRADIKDVQAGVTETKDNVQEVVKAMTE